METETYYDILGLSPNASQREVRSAFSRLAERYRRNMSDPDARAEFEKTKAAYQTLTDYDSRLRYNIERGFPDPPKPGRDGGRGGFLADLGKLGAGSMAGYLADPLPGCLAYCCV